MPGVTTAYQTGVHASRPANGAGCVLYSCTTHSLVYRDDGSSWTTFMTLGGSLPQGLDTTDSPQFAGVNLGHASDTTLTRVSAGVVAIEGTNIVKAGAATGSGLTMATARLLGRTTAASGAIEELTVGSGLTLSGGSLTATGSAGAMTQLADSTLAATATSVTLSSLGGANHLRIIVQARSDRSGQVFEGVDIRFNGDTGSNYDYVDSDLNYPSGVFTGSGAEAFAATAGQVGTITGNSATANVAAGFVIDIPNYGATVFHKGYQSTGHVKFGTTTGNLHNVLYSGLWRSTSAITSVTLLTRNGSNFIVGCRFTAYGLT